MSKSIRILVKGKQRVGGEWQCGGQGPAPENNWEGYWRENPYEIGTRSDPKWNSLKNPSSLHYFQIPPELDLKPYGGESRHPQPKGWGLCFVDDGNFRIGSWRG